MKQILEVQEFKYDSKEEREAHVKKMKAKGFECGSRDKKSDDSIWEDNRKYYWFAHFCKY